MAAEDSNNLCGSHQVTEVKLLVFPGLHGRDGNSQQTSERLLRRKGGPRLFVSENVPLSVFFSSRSGTKQGGGWREPHIQGGDREVWSPVSTAVRNSKRTKVTLGRSHHNLVRSHQGRRTEGGTLVGGHYSVSVTVHYLFICGRGELEDVQESCHLVGLWDQTQAWQQAPSPAGPSHQTQCKVRGTGVEAFLENVPYSLL